MSERAQLFHALSDKTRLAILDRLRGGECCVCDLQTALDAAQSRLSFHLKVLRDAGLVHDRKEGRWSYYKLNPARIHIASRAAAALLEPTRELHNCINSAPERRPVKLGVPRNHSSPWTRTVAAGDVFFWH